MRRRSQAFRCEQRGTAAVQNAFPWPEIDWILQVLSIFTLRFDGGCEEYSQVPIPEFEKG